MRFIEMRGHGGPEVLALAERPAPQPGPGELLIRVLAAGINRPDIAQRKGIYPPPPDASPHLGLEVAGIVERAGEGADASLVGSRVAALTNGGGYAEYVTAPAGQCLPWPAGYDAVRAACLPETGFTVWQNMFALGGLRAGDAALVHGGAGGIGTTAIQYGTALGARIHVTAGSDAGCEACLSLGAASATNYRTGDFAQAIETATGSAGVQLVLDMVGAPYLAANLACLAPFGRLVFIAFQGGAKAAEVDLSIVQRKCLVVTGSTLRPRSLSEKAAIADALLHTVWPVLDAGKAAPVIAQTFPLAHAARAHAALEQGGHFGKFVLTMEH